MAIQQISEHEFDRFSPARSAVLAAFVEEVSWHADTARNIIGAVVLDKVDKDWSFAILGRDPRGAFRAFRTKTSIETQEGAQAQLLAAMAEVEASGQTVFPQDRGD